MTSHEHAPLDGSDLAEAYGITVTTLVDTRVCVILRGSDGLLYFRYRPKAKETLEDFREYHGLLVTSLGPNAGTFGMIVDLNDLDSLTREARAAHAEPNVLACFNSMALVARSSLARAVGGFFIVLDKPPIPTRLFATTDEAREWILKKQRGLVDPDDVMERNAPKHQTEVK